MNINPRILTLLRELDELAKTRDDAWQIPFEEGELLYQIALSTHTRKIIEIGMSYGFSGLWWGAALQQTGGQLHTIDKDPKKYDASRQNFDRAGLTGHVVNYLGDANEVLSKIDGPIDIAFIDADKPATRAYFDMIWPKIRTGGAVITDNMATHRKEMADYQKHLRSLPYASSVEINVGNGIEWTIKTHNP